MASPVEEELVALARVTDPASLALQPGLNPTVRRTSMHDGVEVGIINLDDGASAKFWFKSHHLLPNDLGGTYFIMSDGSDAFMRGHFCWELQLPDYALASLEDLHQFIRDHDAETP